MGADARQQLLDAERLGHVVVGAGVQRLHLGALVIADGENQNRARRLERMARQTSTPLIPGIIRSVMTRSGGHSWKA